MKENKVMALMEISINVLDSLIQAYDNKALSNSVLTEASHRIREHMESNQTVTDDLMKEVTMDQNSLLKLSGSFAHQTNLIIMVLQQVNDDTMVEVAINLARERMLQFFQLIKKDNQGIIPTKKLRDIESRYQLSDKQANGKKDA
ncbi:hypothetical protein D5018_21205 [Parashewanella curva]|uniref:Uncharacterized protein n=1 Tax=Parashewanella curva TaxID=2338552 RepID=A0A3L8PUI2_9GAMM|nr:hypothetical protein [Parashewanella curva]RLV57692.1 hypothetical protein D5018_21205 [Parashewanella curva]